MNISDVMSREVETIPADASVQDAAKLIAELDIAAVLVGEINAPQGILTERDIIVRAVAAGLGADTKVTEIMSSQLFTCRAEDSVEQVSEQMREKQLHQIPVVDEAGRVVGIVTVAGLAKISALPLEQAVQPRAPDEADEAVESTAQ